jgi:predicted RNase H-like HicB family nuclease
MTDPQADQLARFLALEYQVTIEQIDCGEAGPCYLARHPELRGCMSHGATPEEARANLDEARALYLSTLIENGVTPPLPAERTSTMVGIAPAHRTG